MRRAAWFCGAISLAVFVSFYLLPEGVLLPAAGLYALLSALAAALLRGKNRVRAHLALLGAAIGFVCFFVQEHFQVVLYLPVIAPVGNLSLHVSHHFADLDIGSAVAGTLERPESGGNRGICIGAGRRNDVGGEG